MPSHDRRRNVTCVDCGKVRLVIVASPNKPPLRCVQCGHNAQRGNKFIRPAAGRHKTRICTVCGREFQSDHLHTTACSLDCHGIRSRNRISLKCQRCGKEYNRPAAVKWGLIFCSRKCTIQPETKHCLVCDEPYITRHSAYSRFCSAFCRSWPNYLRRRGYGRLDTDPESIAIMRRLYKANREINICKQIEGVLNKIARGVALNESELSEVLEAVC